MKVYAFVALFLICASSIAAQTPDYDANQEITISSDSGLNILSSSDITETFVAPVATYGWAEQNYAEVINYLQSRSSYITVSLSQDEYFIEIDLLQIPQVTDNWGINEWNNHLQTIK